MYSEVPEWLKCKALEWGMAYSNYLGRSSYCFQERFQVHFNLDFELITVPFTESKAKAFNNYDNVYLKRAVCVCACAHTRACSNQVKEPKSIYTSKKNTHRLPVCLFTREQGVTQ